MTGERSDYSPRMYWRYVVRQRSKAKFFSFYRVIPPLIIAVIQFLWLRRNRPIIELAIIAGTIFAVYFVLFAVENIWNIIAITPPKIYAEQVDLIGELGARNSFLEAELRSPPTPPQEQRRRSFVSGELKKLGEVDRKILRYIHDQGQVSAMALKVDSHFNEIAVNNLVSRVLPAGLILYQNHVISIKPELQSALEFVLSAEYDEEP